MLEDIRPFIPLFNAYNGLTIFNQGPPGESEPSRILGLYSNSHKKIKDGIDELESFLTEIQKTNSPDEFEDDSGLLREVREVCFQRGEQIRSLETWDPSLYGHPGTNDWLWVKKNAFQRVRENLVSIDLWRPWQQVIDRRHESRMTV